MENKKKSKKSFVALSIIGGTLLLVGGGIGIGYAIWYTPKQPIEVITDDPRWDKRAFDEMFTWENVLRDGATPSGSAPVSYSISGQRERRFDMFTWFRSNFVEDESSWFGFDRSVDGYVDEETTYPGQGQYLLDKFSYVFNKSPSILFDGTVENTDGERPTAIFATFELNDQGEFIEYKHTQQIIFSPSFFLSSVFSPRLLTVKHLDNRNLLSEPLNIMKNYYEIDVQCELSFANSFSMRVAGKGLDILERASGGSLTSASVEPLIQLKVTTVDGSVLDSTTTWDQTTDTMTCTLTYELSNRRYYKIYFNWDYNII